MPDGVLEYKHEFDGFVHNNLIAVRYTSNPTLRLPNTYPKVQLLVGGFPWMTFAESEVVFVIVDPYHVITPSVKLIYDEGDIDNERFYAEIYIKDSLQLRRITQN